MYKTFCDFKKLYFNAQYALVYTVTLVFLWPYKKL